MKKVILGVTSSVSIYKSCELARLFVKNGYSVFTVMSANATELIRPLLFENLTGNKVYTSLFAKDAHDMAHISLKENASIYVVAPATANSIGKFAHGIADDLISTTFLSVNCPVLIAPAMNPNMWNNKAVQENIEILIKRGIHIIEPETGHVLCGDEGTGKLADTGGIYDKAVKLAK